MNRPEPAKECLGASIWHPEHRSGDGYRLPGTCGFCGRSVQFVTKDDGALPKKHSTKSGTGFAGSLAWRHGKTGN